MKFRWLIFLAILTSCHVSNNPLREEIKLLRKGIMKDDTSYVYALPYKSGKTYRVIQGYFSSFTHKERAALDFNLKPGDSICAAREGIVTRVKEDGKKGGLKKKYRPEGNSIIIQHTDGSRAGYWHLRHKGSLVKTGDTVKKGQPIAISGKTGYALSPHLHFLVWKFEKGNWQQIGTRFQTSKGIKYLKGWKRYKNGW